MTQRNVFEKIPMDGFRTTKVESIAVANNGHRLFVGTNDGSFLAYDCQTSLSSYSKFNCNVFSTIRTQQKEKKPVFNLTVVESWGVIVGIIDGIVTAFDLSSFQVKSSLPDTKGCHVFSLHEYNGIIAVANKRKISLYTWIQPNTSASTAAAAATGLVGFFLRKEVSNLAELPKNIVCVSNAIIVGFKRSYEALDINSFAQTRILDVDRDQRMLCVELPSSELRPASILISQGVQGLLFDLFKVMPSISTSMFSVRLEWGSAPVSIHYLNPFIVSLLQDSVEIHDLASLASLQRIPLPSASPMSAFASSTSASYSFTSCEIDTTNGLEYAYVSTGDQVFVLRMNPLPTQIISLLDSAKFEDAINICILCQNNPQLKDIDIPGVHEKYAQSLFQRGDFDGAIANYIKAETPAKRVLALFPDLVPAAFHSYLGISTPTTLAKSGAPASRTSLTTTTSSALLGTRMAGISLQRAAAAVVAYCEYIRTQMRGQIEIADKMRATTSNAALALENLESLVGNNDWEEVLKIAEVVDTVLLAALINCSPSRRNTVIELLSSSPPNRCHMESSSAILAAQGNAFTEALLWLFRSHNEHKKVLAGLREDRCVGAGNWSREQFYNWTSEYLQWLWFSDDVTLPVLALNSLRPVLEYDAELGLSVLTTRPKNKPANSVGGKGTEIQDIITFLESVRPKPPAKGTAQISAANQRRTSAATGVGQTVSTGGGSANSDAPFLRIPLINGRALGVTYLEWRVNNGTAPAATHDEYAQLLMEGVPLDIPFDHNSNNLDIKPSDPENIVLYKIYRKKLQFFLQTSTDYHPEKLMKFIPSQFLHENALILSKLGKHDEVLNIYVHQIKDLQLAENYCDRIYRRSIEEKSGRKTASTTAGSVRGSTSLHIYEPEDEGVYLILIRVLLVKTDPKQDKTTIPNLPTVVSLAERYYDRINPIIFLTELPKNVPLSSLAKYLTIVIEYASTKKRNLQVVHQLLRVREVNIRTAQYASSSSSS